jgi:hypothetical protein
VRYIVPAAYSPQEIAVSYLRIALAAALLLPCQALAGNFNRQAIIISMYTVQCNPTGFVAAMAGASASASARCSEYVMVSETVEYRIRPHKHQMLLPVGEPVNFSFAKSHLLVRPDDGDEDYEFEVISMELSDTGAAATATRRAHANAR